MHGFLLEFGISLSQGVTVIRRLASVLAEHDLPARLTLLLQRLHDHFVYLDQQVKALDKDLASQLAEDDLGSRLLSMPGVGPITASLLAVGDGKHYACSRDFAASVGLVPKQYSTGGRANLLGISKRGDKKSQTLAGAMRKRLYAANRLPERGLGGLGSRLADTTPFQRGGLRSGQQNGTYRLGDRCTPYPIRSRARRLERLTLRLLLYHDSPFRFCDS